MTTRILPTDKNGLIYYGPRTLAQAGEIIDSIRSNGLRYSQLIEERKLLSSIRRAGFSRVAALVKSSYGISE